MGQSDKAKNEARTSSSDARPDDATGTDGDGFGRVLYAAVGFIYGGLALYVLADGVFPGNAAGYLLLFPLLGSACSYVVLLDAYHVGKGSRDWWWISRWGMALLSMNTAGFLLPIYVLKRWFVFRDGAATPKP